MSGGRVQHESARGTGCAVVDLAGATTFGWFGPDAPDGVLRFHVGPAPARPDVVAVFDVSSLPVPGGGHHFIACRVGGLADLAALAGALVDRSEEHTSELQSLLLSS